MTDLGWKGSRPLTPHMSTFPIHVRIHSGISTTPASSSLSSTLETSAVEEILHFWGALILGSSHIGAQFILVDTFSHIITLYPLHHLDAESSLTALVWRQVTHALSWHLLCIESSEFRVQNRVSNAERALASSLCVQAWADPPCVGDLWVKQDTLTESKESYCLFSEINFIEP